MTRCRFYIPRGRQVPIEATAVSALDWAPFAFLRWRIRSVGRNIACLGVDLGPERQLAANFSREDHTSELASNLTVVLTAVANTDTSYRSPWETARPEDNVFDLEIQVLPLDRPELDGSNNVSLKIAAQFGRTEKTACVEWLVRLAEDDSAKPVVDVTMETDIEDDQLLAVDDEIRINVAAQHRHVGLDEDMPNYEDDDAGIEKATGGEEEDGNVTSTAEAKSLKLGFYLPP